MKHDFERIIQRRNTSSVKWDLADDIFKGRDLLPLWVADMDFASPPAVIDALCKRAEHGVFGYTTASDSYYGSIIGWMKRRHGWNVCREWIHFCPGVVPALSLILETYMRPGDEVIVQRPVYYPFMRVIKNRGCQIVNNPLLYQNGGYSMDLLDLESKVRRHRVRAVILCSPHNPVGRVWTREELQSFARICRERNIIVIADEIHGDLVFPDHGFTPLASLCGELMMSKIITCTSPSKTFNLAGLQSANIVIPDEDLSREFRLTLERNGIQGPNCFGAVACEIAYNEGEDWLEDLLVYLKGNLDYVRGFICEKISCVRMIEPEGTYLVWLDFRELGLDPDVLMAMLVGDGRIALDPGTLFGREGAGFMRINIGCPRSTLAEAMERIERAIAGYR